MPKSGRSQEEINNLAHRQYIVRASGDGAVTEFPTGKDITRLENIAVFVDGLLQRPDSRGTALDYKVRGHTPGYAGDRNMVKFTAAPAVGVDNIAFIINAD